jgi:RHS repeat-associated protein
VGAKHVLRNAAQFAAGKGDATFSTTYSYLGFKTSIKAFKAAAAQAVSSPYLEMSRTRDSRGKLFQTTQKVTNAQGGTDDITTLFKYDPAGNLTELVDKNLNDIIATYDDAGRKRTVNDPDRGLWKYDWDGLGRLERQTDARGVVVTYDYDGIGRTRYRWEGKDPGNPPDVTWDYDQNNKYGTLSKVTGAVVNGEAFAESYQYDSLLRPFKVTTHVPPIGPAAPPAALRDLVVGYGYDQNYGRMKAMSYPSGEVVRFDYDGRGYHLGETQISAFGAAGIAYRRVSKMSVRGQVTEQGLGNGILETADYDASTGLATMTLSTRPPGQPSTCQSPLGPIGSSSLQLVRQVQYSYDHFLNLGSQQKTYYPRDPLAGLPACSASGVPTVASATEVFDYDEMQRLKSGSRSWNEAATTEADTYAFDVLGNITQKSDYGSSYAYGDSARAVNLAGPHAVVSVQKKDGSLASFSYDANGNLVQGDGRTVAFDPADRPVHVAMGAVTSDFFYAPDGARYAQREMGSSEGARTIYYVGKDFERVYWDDGRIEERSYIGPSVVVYRQGAGAPEVRYRHGDRLNSLDAATDSSGKEILADLHGYDAFGKPRGYDWHANPGAAFERLHASEFGVTTNNGFTTHEHLDEVYLIHMNGRVYDYRLGRFLSVDPIISTPANSQSINPYSYIGNSPLSGVDPTGYVAQGGGSLCEGTGGAGNCTVSWINPPEPKGNGQLQQATSSAQGQGTQQPNANPTGHGRPQDTAKNGTDEQSSPPGKRLAQARPPPRFERVPWEERPGGEAERPEAETRARQENPKEWIAAGRVAAAKARAEAAGVRTAEIRAPGPYTEKEAEFWERTAATAEAAQQARAANQGPKLLGSGRPTSFKPGELDNHFSKHAGEWGAGNITKDAYLKRAGDLLGREPGGQILGHTRTNGDILRYNTRTNEFAVGAQDGTIRTLFRPKDGLNYWNKQVGP